MTRSHKVDISGLLAGSGQVLLVEDEVPIESFEGIEFPKPAGVRLTVRYVDRMLHLEGSVDATAHGECDSCLEEVNRAIHVDVDERVDPFAGRDDGPFSDESVLAGDRLDVADLAQQLVLSDLPMGLRCTEECKGLCGICGANLNAGSCPCSSAGTALGSER
jgi:uncharacterized protein